MKEEKNEDDKLRLVPLRFDGKTIKLLKKWSYVENKPLTVLVREALRDKLDLVKKIQI